MPLIYGQTEKSPAVNYSLNEAQLKAIFKEHDADGDGRLSKEELKAAFHRLGAHLPGWRVKRSLRHADVDGDGNISLGELDELVKYAKKFRYRSS
ncbi:hypothetical protein Tsubulata_043166 [Turnera subulata]|uniref:EF-hand domain-containing protein n=1 Tax=Turnera subulata TaxID=218843 RepID=A0A9Q0J9Y8_9ROSI|nr:hypothetical protein Tsubulata_043166 [Turnera subulata]